MARSQIAVTRAALRLLQQGADPVLVLDQLRGWSAARCDPAILDSDLVKTVNMICGQLLHRVTVRAYD
jgi:hypothetical protein